MENKYAPFDEAEFNLMREELSSIRMHLPEHLMNPFWHWCNTIRGVRTNQPL